MRKLLSENRNQVTKTFIKPTILWIKKILTKKKFINLKFHRLTIHPTLSTRFHYSYCNAISISSNLPQSP